MSTQTGEMGNGERTHLALENGMFARCADYTDWLG